MKAIKWENEMSVGVKKIDEQHAYFIDLINDLYDATMQGKIDIAFDEIIKKLSDYAKIHFQTEEKYFDEFKYENSVEHKKIHAELLKQIEAFHREHQEFSKIDLSLRLLDFLEDWLVDHLESEDKQYMECFKSHGLK